MLHESFLHRNLVFYLLVKTEEPNMYDQIRFVIKIIIREILIPWLNAFFVPFSFALQVLLCNIHAVLMLLNDQSLNAVLSCRCNKRRRRKKKKKHQMQQLYNLITDLLWYLRKLNIKRSWASLDCNCVIGLWIQFIIVERWISALGYGLSHQLPSQVCLIKTLYICQFIVFFFYIAFLFD